MNIIHLQILTTFAVLLWFDLFKVYRIILKMFGFERWTPKADLPKYLKWVACYFCTSFWIGVIASINYYTYTGDGKTALILIMSNTIASRILDYLLGYQSFKP